jgi:hypothetical protein
MKAFRTAALLFCIVGLTAACGSLARADEHDKLTIFTFSQPVELPGVTLPAGTYAFRLLDSFGDRNVVQVFNKDLTHLYATVLTIPDYQGQPSEKTVVRFSETPAGGPPALKEWFYPGDEYGQEFVYPKNRAMELAKASNQSVPSMPSDLASDITKPAKNSNDAGVSAMKNAPLKAERANGQETEVGDSFATKRQNNR